MQQCLEGAAPCRSGRGAHDHRFRSNSRCPWTGERPLLGAEPTAHPALERAGRPDARSRPRAVRMRGPGSLGGLAVRRQFRSISVPLTVPPISRCLRRPLSEPVLGSTPTAFQATTALPVSRSLNSSRWGKKWGKVPHRLQPISAVLDLAKTALDRAPRVSATLPLRPFKRTVYAENRRSLGQGRPLL